MCYLTLTADTGGINQPVGFTIHLKDGVDGIPRGTRLIADQMPLFAQNTIDQGRFAHIGATDDRQPDGTFGRSFNGGFIDGCNPGHQGIQKIRYPISVFS